MLKNSSFNTCMTITIFEHHFFGKKKARVFRLFHFLTMVKSTWVGEWMRIGRRHPLHSFQKVPMYMLVCPPLCHVGSGSLSRRTYTLFTPAPSKGGRCSYLSIYLGTQLSNCREGHLIKTNDFCKNYTKLYKIKRTKKFG